LQSSGEAVLKELSPSLRRIEEFVTAFFSTFVVLNPFFR